jgi:outer membrane protein assembly factor BamB
VWLTYHAGNARLGIAAAQPSLDPLRLVWRAPLDGTAVYGEPLAADGRVFVATEGDDVFALDSANGRVDWEVRIGDPLRNVASAAEAGCGDIDPLGITSTPVIDLATNTIFAVGEVSTGGSQPVHHQLVGINLDSGHQTFSVNADPPLGAGESSVYLLQRPALALAGGRVYIGYGGNFGDCGTYHGWVVGISVPSPGRAGAAQAGAGQEVVFDVTPDSSGGAVWQGGAGPSVGSGGAVYVTTGNPNSAGPDPWAEAVVKLAPDLASPPEHSFQDVTATDDEDLSTGDPILLPDGDLFAVGKTDHGYILRQSDLAEVATIRGTVCGSNPDGGEAYDPATNSIYVPCRGGGIQQVNLTTLSTGWQAGDVNSGPIVVDGALWALSYPDGALEEIDPASGAVIQSTEVDAPVPNFASPSAALGLLLVGTESGVAAFAGPTAG